MTPLRLRASGLGVLRDLDLDLGALPEGLIAITGVNGSGKTTIADLLGFTPIYRAWSSKPGELRDYATGPARVDLDVELAGSVYALRLRIDPNARGGAGQTDATITRDGAPLTDGTRVADYDLAVCDWPGRDGKPGTRGVFPSRRLMLASAFSAQDRSGSFAALSPAERKAFFGELLGTEEHQERSVAARARGAALDTEIAALARDLDRAEADLARAEALRSELAAAEFDDGAASHLAETARAAHEAATAALASAKAERDGIARRVEEHARARAALAKQLDDREAELNRAASGLDDLALLTERAPAIRSRAALLTEAEAALTARRTGYEAAARDLEFARAREADAATARDAALTARARAERASADLARDLAGLPALTARAARLAELTERLAKLREEGTAAADAAAKLRATATTRAAAVASDLRAARAALAEAERAAETLGSVPCGGREGFAGCRFLGAAAAARDDLPARREAVALAEAASLDVVKLAAAASEAERALAALRSESAGVQAEIEPLRGADTALAVLRRDAERAETIAADLATATAEASAAEVRSAAARGATQSAAANLDNARKLGAEARAARDALAGADVELRRLDVALASAEPLRAAHAAAERARAGVLEQLGALGNPPDDGETLRALQAASAELARTRADLDSATATARAAAATLARLRGALDALGSPAERAAELRATRDRLALRRAGFAEVERAFGREGIQALEIDAAGPEVSRLTNELLSTVSGGRFAVSLVTLQEASGGRKQREVFDLRVLDGDRAHAGIAFERLSLGEQCLVGEALKLALAVHNTRRSGRELRTLFRDEGDRDLDAERRAAYPAMLKRAMELGGFTRCYLISHDERVWAQADARIEVSEGRARIM